MLYYVAGYTQSAILGQLYKVFCEAKKNGMCFFISRLYCALVMNDNSYQKYIEYD